MRWYPRVGRWIPAPLIDAIGDTDEPIAQPAEDAVEAEAAGSGAELMGVRRAHRCHRVREDETAL